MDQVESGEFDLLVTEDLGRILRRARAIEFVEMCVDCDTRVITVNGGRIDTAVKGWEDSAFIDSWHQERSKPAVPLLERRHLRRRTGVAEDAGRDY